MIFVACRAADFVNLFVGLWLVPKFVDPTELGAVLPLTTFAGVVVLPVTVFTTVFTKEVNTLATNGEFGKMKTLIRSVFIAAGVFLAVAILGTKLVMPIFLERIRIQDGSLSILVIASSFIGCVASVYSNVLQALKRFKAYTFLCVISAPLRFLTMLVAMPYRALSGYFVGQSAGPGFSIFASLFFLRRELSAKAEPYWTRPVIRRFSILLAGVATSSIVGSLLGLVEQTVLRQRLPDLDSAANYMVSRFSEVAGMVTITLSLTLFPYTAECATRGQSTRPLVVKATLATLALGTAIALFFTFFGRPILAFLPHGTEYASYYWAIPWEIVLRVVGSFPAFYVSTEISAARFGFLKWYVPYHLLAAAFLLGVTGYGYFAGYLPASWSQFLATHNFTSLESMLWLSTATTLVTCAFCARDLLRQK